MNNENAQIYAITLIVFTIAVTTNVFPLPAWAHFVLGTTALILGTYVLYEAIRLWREE